MGTNNTVFGVQGLWVTGGGKSAFIVNVEAVTFTDSTALVESKNSFGVTTNIFTGDRPCSWSFTAQDISPLAKSIMTGYKLRDAAATTARTGHVQARAGDWTAAFTVADDADLGVYLVTSEDGSAAKFQKLIALGADVLVNSAPAQTDAVDGITIDFTKVNAGDSAILTVQPPAAERGTTTIDPFTVRPSFTISASSDIRGGGAPNMACIIHAPQVMMAEMPTTFTTVAVGSGEFSGMVMYSNQINGYYEIQDIVI